MSTSRREVDVLVVGAGPAGAALALALRRAGVAGVLLVDRPVRRPFRIGESAAPSLGSLLCRLGLDDRLEDHGHRPCYGNLVLWGGPVSSAEDFMSHGYGPGWHLDREGFDAWLRAEAVASGVQLLTPARLVEAWHDGRRWRAYLRVEGPVVEVRAQWVVDATGRSAALGRRTGARLHRLDQLLALAAITEPTQDACFTGFSLVEAAEIGWWYAARLPRGAAVVALLTDADLAREADLMSPNGFRRAWVATSELGRSVRPPCNGARPTVFAAGTQFLDHAVGLGWLALGDALMAFDPLSAAGITGALEDAIAAADMIARLLRQPSCGEADDLRAAYAARADAMLRRYLSERRAIYRREGRWARSAFWQRRFA